MAGLCVGPRFFSVWLQKRIIYLFDKSNEQQGIISFIVSFWNENSFLGVVGKFVEGRTFCCFSVDDDFTRAAIPATIKDIYCVK